MFHTASRIALSLAALAAIAGCSGGSQPAALPVLSSSVAQTFDAVEASAARRATAPTVPTASYAATVLADAPLAYYRLDDAGSTVNDASGHALTGTYGSAVRTGAASALPGDTDTAAAFPGGAWSANSLVRIPANAKLEPAAAVTVEAWAKASSVNDNAALVSFGDNTNDPHQPYAIKTDSQTNLFMFMVAVNGTQQTVTSRTPLTAGKTFHVVGTFDGSALKMYVNGVLEGTTVASGSITHYDSINGLAVGGRLLGPSSIFAGTLDEVAIYGKALQSARVGAHYAAGTASRSGTLSVPSVQPSAVPATPLPTPAAAAPPPGVTPTLTNGGFVNARDYSTSFTPWGPTSPINMRISANPVIASYSAAVVARQFPNGRNDNPIRATEAGKYDYAHPRFYASSTDPLVNVRCNQYCNAPDNGGVPATIRIPAKARPAGGTDAHFDIIQPDGTDVTMWAAYGTPGNGSGRYSDPEPTATRDWQNGDTVTAGNVANCGSAFSASGILSSGPGPTAAYFCDGAATVTAAELAIGQIHHALAVTGECAIGNQFPANPNSSTQQCTSGVGPPLGGREWYDVPCSTTQASTALYPWEKAILCALNQYGGYMMDNGSGGAYFTGGVSGEIESEEPWYDYYGQNYTSPFAALSSQGWQSYPIANVRGGNFGNAGIRWNYPGDANGNWNPPGVNFPAHIHWLAPCSANGSC